MQQTRCNGIISFFERNSSVLSFVCSANRISLQLSVCNVVETLQKVFNTGNELCYFNVTIGKKRKTVGGKLEFVDRHVN